MAYPPSAAVRSAPGSKLSLIGATLPEPARPTVRASSPLFDTRAEEFNENTEEKAEEIIANMCPSELEMWMNEMPKGGDLQLNLHGSIPAEKLLGLAIRENLYYDPKTHLCSRTIHSGAIPASAIPNNSKLLFDFYGAYTIRNSGENDPHIYETYYNSFRLINSILENIPAVEKVEIIREQARKQHLVYVEMLVALSTIKELANSFEELRKKKPEIRFQVVVSRTLEKDEFIQRAAEAFGFLERYTEDIVNVNLEGPEADFKAQTGFYKQMEEIEKLRKGCQANPRLSMRCGELTEKLSSREFMEDRIQKTILSGNCVRIGGGISITKELDGFQVLKEMSKKRIAVEVCFREKLLGLKPEEHPVHTYVRYNVPVVLCSGDAGVTRESLTAQYYKAIKDYNFTYSEIKKFLRNSLEYSFLPGKSIFANSKFDFIKIFIGIDGENWEVEKDVNAVRLYLELSPKARLQYDLERQLVEFERKVIEANR